MPTEGNVTISVVCPTHNSSSFITETIRSVINQVCQPQELIIVDDGSTDETVSVVKRIFKSIDTIKTKLIINNHQGPGAARNAGIIAANSEWIAFLDSDDFWLPNKILRMVDEIRLNPQCNFICHSEQKSKDGSVVSVLDYGRLYDSSFPIPKQLYARNFFSTSAVLAKRKLLLDYGGFDESLMSSQDYDLWLRLSPDMRVCYVADVLGEYRYRDGNITSGRIWPRYRNSLRILWRHRNKADLSGVILRLMRLIYGAFKESLFK